MYEKGVYIVPGEKKLMEEDDILHQRESRVMMIIIMVLHLG